MTPQSDDTKEPEYATQLRGLREMLGNQADLSIVSIRVVGAARDLVNSTDVIDDDAESMFVRVSGDDWRELLHCLEIWEILVHDLGDDDAEPTEI